VADEQDRAVEIGEIFLEPGDGGQIEVVGRLVEQEQIALADEQLRQRQSRALAAGKRADVLFPLSRSEADAEEHGFEACAARRIRRPARIRAGRSDIY
jgi:hypothetical protein